MRGRGFTRDPSVAPTGSISNAELATMAASTIKGNATAGTAAPTDLTALQAWTVMGMPGVSVLQYGAVRDGATDDTTAIQAAITAVGAAGGGTVWIPRNVYRFTTLSLVSANVVLLGEPGTILETTTLTGNIISLGAVAGLGCRNIHVRTSGTPSSSVTFRLLGDDQFLDRCTVENAFYGVLTTVGSRIRIENCRFVSTADIAILIGLIGEACAAPIIAGNIIQAVAGTGNAIWMRYSSDGLVSGNQIVDVTGGDAILIDADAPRTRVIGNLIAGGTDDGILLNGAADCVIESNVISGFTDRAIDVATATTGAIVRNNRCTGNGTNGPVVPTYTLASDIITLKGDFGVPVVVDTEAAAASDALVTINGGQLGQQITVVAANGARDVVVTDTTGNIQLSANMTLNNIQDAITLLYDGSIWREVGRCDAGA